MDRTLWKLNGQTFEELGIEAPKLTFVNGAPDVFAWEDPATRFDSDLRWAYDAAVVLSRGETVVFSGKIRQTPRFLGQEAESIAYEAHGPWATLQELAYLQDATFVQDPEAEELEYLVKQHGRAVLGLRLLGAREFERVNLAEAIADVLALASDVVQVGSITGLGWQVPLDEVVDLQLSDALNRLLQWAPDAVQWFDYSASPPAYRAGRRAGLAEVNLVVPLPGQGGEQTDGSRVPLETVSLRPAHELQAPAVVLFFRRGRDTEGAAWAVLEKQAAPVDATGREPRAIVRTIDLADATTVSSSRQTAKIRTTSLSSFLATAGTITPASNATAFNALAAFWKRKLPELDRTGVTITGFKDCTRERIPLPGDASTATTPTSVCTRELVLGQLPDWLFEQISTLRAEHQVIGATIAYDELVDGVVKKRILTGANTKLVATNASTRVYSQQGGVVEIGAPGEPAMPGLADQIRAGLSTLHHEGTITLVEEEATLSVRPGVVVNLTCDARPEWATMKALVQAVTVDIDQGSTQITVGPPHHLGPQELQELFRSNRTRREVTTAYSRVSGRNDQGTLEIPVAET